MKDTNTSVKTKVFNWIIFGLYALVIFLASSRPLPAEVPFFSHIDKLYHLLAYLVMSLLFLRALKSSALGVLSYLIVFLTCIFIGTAIEFYQEAIAGRDSSFWDAVFNGIGAVVGIIIYRFMEARDDT